MAPSRGKLLVVDDDEELRMTLADVLELEGYEVVTAANGQEALGWMRHFLPDLILLDLRMPVMSGPELCRILRAHPQWRFIPILVVSAAMPDELAGLDIDGVIRKPFDLDQLTAKVEAGLRLSGRAAWSQPDPAARY